MNFRYMILAFFIGNIISFILMILVNSKLKSILAQPQQYSYNAPPPIGASQYGRPQPGNFPYPDASSTYPPEPSRPGSRAEVNGQECPICGAPAKPQDVRCRICGAALKPDMGTAPSHQYPLPEPVPAHNPVPEMHDFYTLERSVNLMVPHFIDQGSSAEIVVELSNNGSTTITDVSVDFSQMEEDFEVRGNVSVRTLTPGKALEQRVVIKPRYDKGSFPVRIVIRGSGAKIEKDFTIKVGGTEIY